MFICVDQAIRYEGANSGKSAAFSLSPFVIGFDCKKAKSGAEVTCNLLMHESDFSRRILA
jgi:hypothetical protein